MLTKKLKNYNLILASNSPRRQAFFKDLNLTFTVKTKNIEEIYPTHLKEHEISNFLAKLKASAFKNELKENDLLITSDTIVWHNNKALGKPKDFEEAFNTLQKLSNTKHQVITSIALTTPNFQKVLHDSTTVYFKKLSTEEIKYYIENYKPFDKAGSYGIQEWIGNIGITKIEGSYFNVMGLPTHKLYQELLNL